MNTAKTFYKMNVMFDIKNIQVIRSAFEYPYQHYCQCLST